MFGDTAATVQVLSAVLGPLLGLAGVLAGVIASRRTQVEAQRAAKESERAANDVETIRVAHAVLTGTISELRAEVARKDAELDQVRRQHGQQLEALRRQLAQVQAAVVDLELKRDRVEMELVECHSVQAGLRAELERLRRAG